MASNTVASSRPSTAMMRSMVRPHPVALQRRRLTPFQTSTMKRRRTRSLVSRWKSPLKRSLRYFPTSLLFSVLDRPSGGRWYPRRCCPTWGCRLRYQEAPRQEGKLHCNNPVHICNPRLSTPMTKIAMIRVVWAEHTRGNKCLTLSTPSIDPCVPIWNGQQCNNTFRRRCQC